LVIAQQLSPGDDRHGVTGSPNRRFPPKAAVDGSLSKAIFNFGIAAEQAGGLEAATAVAD
jgi:hypothetical protein